MNTITQTLAFDSNSGDFLEPDMARLLQMTNEVVMKINLQTKEMYQ